MIIYNLNLASRLGLYNTGDNCLSGTQIDELSDSDLEKVIRSVTVFYRTSPKHKLKIVKVCFFYKLIFI